MKYKYEITLNGSNISDDIVLNSLWVALKRTKLSFDVVNNETGEILIPAKRSIRKGQIKKMLAASRLEIVC